MQKLISQVSEFVAKLSARDKKFLIAGVILVIVVSFDLLFIAPTMSRLASLNEEIVKEENVIKQDVHFLTYKNKIIKESQAISPFLTDKIPTDDEIISLFLKKIEMIATKANVVLAKVTPSVGGVEKEFLKYTADLECSGTFTDVITFMHLINSSNELTKITKYNLVSKKADSDEIKATMIITKVIIPKKDMPKPANPTPAASNLKSDVSNAKTK